MHKAMRVLANGSLALALLIPLAGAAGVRPHQNPGPPACSKTEGKTLKDAVCHALAGGHQPGK